MMLSRRSCLLLGAGLDSWRLEQVVPLLLALGGGEGEG